MRIPRAALAKRQASNTQSNLGSGAGEASGDHSPGTAAHEVQSGGPQLGVDPGALAPSTEHGTAAHPSAVLGLNPLDSAVDALVENAEYVSKTHIDKLVKLFALHGKDVRDLDMDLDQPVDLRYEINRQFRLLRQVQSAVTGSNDVEQIKKVLSASREIFQNLMKFQDTVHLQERSQAFENAVVEAMKDLDNPELMKKFRFLVAQKLSKTSKAAA